MKAFIFAAGLGKRLTPLTNTTPKPLIEIAGKPLIVYHLEKLANIGVRDVVINAHWLRDKLVSTLGDGLGFGLNISWSIEDELLDTGGGLKNALPLLGVDKREPFYLVNGDIWTDYNFLTLPTTLNQNVQAHLVLVKNPSQHLNGDFSLLPAGGDAPGYARIASADAASNTERAERTYTYAGFGVFTASIFDQAEHLGKKFPLLPVFQKAINGHKLTGEIYSGLWEDVGTRDRLDRINKRLTSH